MATGNAKHDGNFVPTLTGVSSSDGTTVTPVYVDPTTNRLYVDASVTLSANSSVNVAQVNGVTTSTGSGVMGTGVIRVAIASDNDAVTVKQATAGNLNATVVGTGTFVVQATLAAETTKVIGTVNQGTSPWVVSGAVTNTVLSVVGGGTEATAQRVTLASDSTGVLTVKQATAGNLNATVVGTGTFAVQATLQTQTDTVMVGGVNIKEINAVTPLMGNGTTGTGSQRVTIASDNTPFPVKLDQTTPGTTNAVSVAQIGATTIVNGGTAGSLSVGGMVANNGTINSAVNPILVGGQAVSSENAANTTAKLSQFVTDLVGKLIVLPYANPENFVSGAITSAMTGTTSTSLIGSPGGSLRNYITQITVSNAHATVGTDMIVQDGSGGTTLYTIPAAAVYGGAAISFPVPLRQPTTATAIYIQNVTTGASTKASASGYKGL